MPNGHRTAELRSIAFHRMVADMRDLRQNTPFAGSVPARERWRIISEIW